MPYVIEDRTTKPWTSDNDMMICRYYLNHRINAERVDAVKAKDGSFAGSNTDALFLCAESGVQACFSFAHDSENIYLRIDRLDKTPDPLDCERLSVLAGDKTIDITRAGDKLTAVCDGEELLREFTTEKVDAKDTQDSDQWGVVTVMSIKKPCECDFVRIYAELDDKNEDGQVTAAFTGVNKDNTDTWFKVELD